MASCDRDSEKSIEEILNDTSERDNIDFTMSQNRYKALSTSMQSTQVIQRGGKARAERASHEDVDEW